MVRAAQRPGATAILGGHRPTRAPRNVPACGGLDQLLDTDEGDWGLGHTSLHDRFAEDDLPSILNHHATDATGQAPPQVRTGL